MSYKPIQNQTMRLRGSAIGAQLNLTLCMSNSGFIWQQSFVVSAIFIWPKSKGEKPPGTTACRIIRNPGV